MYSGTRALCEIRGYGVLIQLVTGRGNYLPKFTYRINLSMLVELSAVI